MLSVLTGLIRYWLPFSLLIYMYYGACVMADALYRGDGSVDYAFHGGILIMSMAFLGCVTSWIQARIVHEQALEQGTSEKLKVAGLRIYAVIWVGFFFGGLLMFGMATGAADWLFVEVLGW